jgi:plasmid stability protein
MVVSMMATVHNRSMAELRIRNMPELLRRRLKIAAAEEGKSMNAVVIELLAEALAKRKPPG